MGTEGIEPSRLAAHDPKSCSSASSDTSPGNPDLGRQHANIKHWKPLGQVLLSITFLSVKSRFALFLSTQEIDHYGARRGSKYNRHIIQGKVSV